MIRSSKLSSVRIGFSTFDFPKTGGCFHFFPLFSKLVINSPVHSRPLYFKSSMICLILPRRSFVCLWFMDVSPPCVCLLPVQFTIECAVGSDGYRVVRAVPDFIDDVL